MLLSLLFVYLESYFFTNRNCNLPLQKLSAKDVKKAIAELCMFGLQEI